MWQRHWNCTSGKSQVGVPHLLAQLYRICLAEHFEKLSHWVFSPLVADEAHTREIKAMQMSGNVETILVPAEIVGGRLDYPRRVSKVKIP